MTTEQEHFRNITALWHEAQQSGGGGQPATEPAGSSGRLPGSTDEEFESIKERFEETAALKPGTPEEDDGDTSGTEISVIVESMIREKLHGEFAEFIRDAVRDVVRDEIEKQLAARNDDGDGESDGDGDGESDTEAESETDTEAETETPADNDSKEN